MSKIDEIADKIKVIINNISEEDLKNDLEEYNKSNKNVEIKLYFPNKGGKND